MDDAQARDRAQQAIALLAATYDEQGSEAALKLLTDDLARRFDAAGDLLKSLPPGAAAPKESMLALLTEVMAASDELRGTIAGAVGVARVLVQQVALLTGKPESEVLQDLALLFA